jgi:hypothetical protein
MHTYASGPSELQLDDGTRKIKTKGCEYRISKATLIEFLFYYGEFKSDIVETMFENGVTNHDVSGKNRRGTNTVKIKLTKEILQLLPILGKQINIYYPGISRLCPNCFGRHPKPACKSKRAV